LPQVIASKNFRVALTVSDGRNANTLAQFAALRDGQYHGPMNLGMPEMIFIFLLALIVFGPKKLPELARQLGKIMADFKRATNDFKYQLENEIDQLDLQAKREEQEKLRARQLAALSEPTILPPAQGPVPSSFSTAATAADAPGSTVNEPEQLSFEQTQPAESSHDLQREPNV